MILAEFDTVLLDMNATFMFGHDRFGPEEDYGTRFVALGGTLDAGTAHAIVAAVLDYLEPLYTDPAWRECFPGVTGALDALVPDGDVNAADRERLVVTFAHHERGTIPDEHAAALRRLATTHRLGLVADIWAPSDAWRIELERTGIADVFSYQWFSSDHGIVKPSAVPFRRALAALDASPERTVVVGDSVRRDLGGAAAAGLPCILVGGADDPCALHCAGTLLDLL